MDKKNSLINLGCRLNIYEGEIIKDHLNNNNIKNVTVINSCAVTAEAEKKVAYEIRKAKRNIHPEIKYNLFKIEVSLLVNIKFFLYLN